MLGLLSPIINIVNLEEGNIDFNVWSPSIKQLKTFIPEHIGFWDIIN